MRTVLICTILVGLFATGCDMLSSGSSGGKEKTSTIAVVDMDEIAKELGRLEEIEIELKEFQDQLNSQLGSLQASYQQTIQDEKTAIGDDPSEEQQQKLQDITSKLNNKLLQERNDAQRQYTQYRTTLLSKFRKDLKPIAMEVAKERGMSVVLPKSDAVLLAFDDDIDITNDVLERMRGGGATSTEVEEE